MRLIFTMASLLVISLLIFNSYANGPARDPGIDVSSVGMEPISRAKNVSQIVQGNARLQQQALDKQTRY